ncbi:MAG: MotA/TolQ/ExbB proton channel family protein [Bacteroidetes bacterium]|nr:MotA/TolQ/ExbB proton channel family protein [Bacteroidota bacterium]
MLTTLLQITADSSAAIAGPEKTTLVDLALKGGVVMIPIAVLFVLSIYLFIERWLTIRKASRVDKNFMRNIRDYVVTGNIEAARMLCKNTDTPIARMIEKGVLRIGKPLKNIEVAIENVGKLEIYKMEKNLATMATISGAAPMIGFLGTVTGMIRAFFQLASNDNVVASDLAGGIYEAMITTAAGLAVGIIAYIGYNLLVALVEKVVYNMEATSVEFMDLLQEPAA